MYGLVGEEVLQEDHGVCKIHLCTPHLDLGILVCVIAQLTADNVSELEYEITTISTRSTDNIHKRCETVNNNTAG